MVDDVVVSFPLATEVAGEIAVGVCVDSLLVERTLVFALAGTFDRLMPRDLRNRSRFLGFSPDISENLRYQVRLVGWATRFGSCAAPLLGVATMGGCRKRGCLNAACLKRQDSSPHVFVPV